MESIQAMAQGDAGRGQLEDECESERQGDAGGVGSVRAQQAAAVQQFRRGSEPAEGRVSRETEKAAGASSKREIGRSWTGGRAR